MDVGVDHYAVLGLPSGEEGAGLSEHEISKAYRSKAIELHPDKSDDPNAHDNFLKLQNSYQVLRDQNARKLFDDQLRIKREKATKLRDDLLRTKREKIHRQEQQDSKRRKMIVDLEERERSAFAVGLTVKDRREEEERYSQQMKQDIAVYVNDILENEERKSQILAEVIATCSNKNTTRTGSGDELDKARVLKVSWDKIGGEGYTDRRISEIFGQFGKVEGVAIKSFKKKVSALVVMESKDDAVSATTVDVLGDRANPLVVRLLRPDSRSTIVSVEPNAPKFSNFVSTGYQIFDLVQIIKSSGRV